MAREIKIDIRTTADMKQIDALVKKISSISNAVKEFNKAAKGSDFKNIANAASNINKISSAMSKANKQNTVYARNMSGLTRTLQQQSSAVAKVASSMNNQVTVARRLTTAEGQLAKAEKSRADAQREYQRLIEGGKASKEELDTARKQISAADQLQKEAKETIEGVKQEVVAYRDLNKQQEQLGKTIERIASQGKTPAANILNQFAKGKDTLAAFNKQLSSVGDIDKRLAGLSGKSGATQGRITQIKQLGDQVETLAKQWDKEQKEAERAAAEAQKAQERAAAAQKKADELAATAAEKAAQRQIAADEKVAVAAEKAAQREAVAAQKAADKEAADAQKAADKQIAAEQKAADAKEKLEMRQQVAADKYLDASVRKEQQAIERATQAQAKFNHEMTQLNLDNKIAGMRNMVNVLNTLQNAINRVMTPIRQFVATIGQLAGQGISAASRAVGTLTNSASSMFARLRSSLDGTGKGFLGFGKSAQSGMGQATKSIQQFYSAGWSLLASGAILNRLGDRVFGTIGNALNQYMDYEKSLTRTAISAAQPVTGPNGETQYQTNPDILQSAIFDIQRGNKNRPGVYQFSANDLAQGLYYYTSAIGQPVTEQNKGAVADVVSRIMQMAAVTQTAPETAVKGAVNVALEFGIDPRDTRNAEKMGNIAAQMGYLANLSTMEVPDIAETFKMLGPMAHILSGKNRPGAGLNEAMTLAFFGSEVGLRGSNIGRGINQALTTLLDPTDKAVETAADAFGIGVSKEAFHEFFFNAEGELKGGLPGLFEKLSKVPSSQAASFLATLFTTNATRAVIGIQQAIDQHGGIDGILQDMAGKNPMQWLSEAVLATNNTIFGNFQNLKNAWFAVQASIIQGISGPLKGAFKSLADILWRVYDTIAKNPAIAKLIGYFLTLTGAVLSFVGAMLVTAGTLLLVARAFAMLGTLAHPLMMLFMSLPRMLLAISPIMLLLTAGSIALYTAWTSNFMGMRDAVQGFIKSFSFEKDVIPKIESLLTWIARLGAAFKELVAGIFLGVGPTNNLAGMLMSFFGPMTGSFLFGQLLNLSKSLEGFRQSFQNFVHDLTSSAGKLHDVGLVIQGFFEEVLFGTARSEAARAQADLGKALGIDDLPTDLLRAGNAVRNFFGMFVGYAQALGGVLAGEIGKSLANIGTLFSQNTFGLAIQGLQGLLTGIAQGFASVLVGATKALTAFTDQLARAGDAGRWIAGYIQQWTGLSLTVSGVAKAIGVAIGSYLGLRLVTAITPGLAIVVKLGTYVGQFGVILAGATIQVALFAAKMAVLTASMLVQGALYITQTALVSGLALAKAALTATTEALTGAKLAEEAASIGGTLANTGLIASVIGLSAATAPLLLVFGAVVVVMGAFAAIGFIIAGVFSAIAVAVVANVAITQGLTAAWAAIVEIFNGFMSIAGPVAGMIASIAVGFANLAVSLVQAISQGNQFEAIGKGIAIGLTLIVGGIAAVVVALAGLAIAFVASFVAANIPIFATIAVLAALAVALSDILGYDNVFSMLRDGFLGVVGWAGEATRTVETFVGTLKNLYDIASKLMHLGGAGGTSPTNPQSDALLKLQREKQDYITQSGAYMAPENRQAEAIQKASDEWTRKNGGYTAVALDPYNGPTLLDPIELQRYKDQQAARQQTQPPPYEPPAAAGGTAAATSGGGFPQISMDDIAKKVSAWTGYDVSKVTKVLSGAATLPAGASNQKFTASLVNSLPQMKQIYDAQLKEYQHYTEQIRQVGVTAAQKEYTDAGMAVPKMPDYQTVMDAWASDTTGAVEDAGQTVDEAITKMQTDLSDSLKDLDIGTVLSGMFDSGLGKGGKSAFSAIYDLSDTIMQNIGDKGPWLNPTEILADVAGTGTGAWNVAGQNLQKALRPQLAIISQQTGVSISDMLKDVPKFIAPEQFVPMATGELVKGLSHIGESVYQKLDVIGQDIYDEYGNQMEQYGLDWAELTTYAVGQAVAGNDWNLSNYLAESWGISVEEANQYLASHGIDPGVITQKWFNDTKQLADSLGGQVSVVTEEQMQQLAKMSNNFTDKTLEVTRAEFDALSDGAKIGFTKLGYTFVIEGENTGKKAAESASTIAKEFRERWFGPDGVGHGIRKIGEDVAQGLVQVQDAVTGAKVWIPAVDYADYKKTAEEARAEHDRLKNTMAEPIPMVTVPKVIQGDATGVNMQNYLPPKTYNFDATAGPNVTTLSQALGLGTTPAKLEGPEVDSSKTLESAKSAGQQAADTLKDTYVAQTQVNASAMSAATTTAVQKSVDTAATSIQFTAFTDAGTQAAQAFATSFSTAMSTALATALSGGMAGVGTTTGAALNPFGGDGGGTTGGPFDALFQGYATSALQAFTKEMSGEKIQAAIATATSGSGGGGQAQETGPFDAAFKGYAYSALTHFAQGIGEQFNAVLGNGTITGIEAGTTSPFDTQFENYATIAVQKFWDKIPAAWASNPKTFAATGAGAAAAGNGASPFDTQFENYATVAIQKFWDKVSASWTLNMPTLSGGTSPFDSVFQNYAVSAAQIFKDTMNASLAGWQPSMAPPSGRGTGVQQFDADPAGASAAAPQTMSMKLTLDTSDFDTKLAGISTAMGVMSSTPFQAKLTADATQFYDAYDAAFNAGYTWRDSTFTAKISADATLFYGAYDAAFDSGNTFAAQIFTSVLNADATLFYGAYDAAFNAGRVWDGQIFTATLAVNDYATGVVNNLAQALTNLNGRVATVQTTTVNTTVNETITKASTAPGNAAGGIIHAAGGYAGTPAGLSFVGERGMELTALPDGTRVVSNAQTMNMLKMAMAAALMSTPQTLSLDLSSASLPPNTDNLISSDSFRRDPQWTTQPQQQAPQINVNIDNVNIAKEVDVDNAVKRFDRLIGHKMELTRRGVVPVNGPQQNL